MKDISAILNHFDLEGAVVDNLLEQLRAISNDGTLQRDAFMKFSEGSAFREAFEEVGANGEADLEKEVIQIFDTMTQSSGKMQCKDLPDFIRTLGTDDMIVIETVRVALVSRSIGGEAGYLTDDALRNAFKEDVFKDVFYNPDEIEMVVNSTQPKVRFSTETTDMCVHAYLLCTSRAMLVICHPVRIYGSN